MFREDPGDVIVDDDHFVNFAVPLLCEHADGGGAAADAHAFFLNAVDDGRTVGLHDDSRAVFNLQLHGFAVAQIQ